MLSQSILKKPYKKVYCKLALYVWVNDHTINLQKILYDFCQTKKMWYGWIAAKNDLFKKIFLIDLKPAIDDQLLSLDSEAMKLRC